MAHKRLLATLEYLNMHHGGHRPLPLAEAGSARRRHWPLAAEPCLSKMSVVGCLGDASSEARVDADVVSGAVAAGGTDASSVFLD